MRGERSAVDSKCSGYHNVNTNTSSNVDLYKLNVKVEAAGQDGPN